MIALKEDPIWTKISRFGTPYPPFDFNSGMGVEDVSYDEAVELGVIQDDYQPPEKSPMRAFNEKLEADCEFKNDDNYDLLKTIFGDQIRQDGDKIVWRQDVFKDAFLNRKQFRIEVGNPTSRLLGLIPDSDMALQTAEKPLVVTQQWLDRRRGKDKKTDHRIHFQPMADEPNDIPLTMADIELIPAIWREPDRVTINPKYKDTFMCEMDTPDGGVLKMAVDVGKGTPALRTLYKVKKPKNNSRKSKTDE